MSNTPTMTPRLAAALADWAILREAGPPAAWHHDKMVRARIELYHAYRETLEAGPRVYTLTFDETGERATLEPVSEPQPEEQGEANDG